MCTAPAGASGATRAASASITWAAASAMSGHPRQHEQAHRSVRLLVNDLADLEADRAHPVKCRRPLASGRVSARAAQVTGVGLMVAGLLDQAQVFLERAGNLHGMGI